MRISRWFVSEARAEDDRLIDRNIEPAARGVSDRGGRSSG